MLWNASAINDYTIEATDGAIGTISDFLFDDAGWSVPWVVVDTGNWLAGRKVILPTSAFGHPDPDKQAFAVNLTRQQVDASPVIGSEHGLSRQAETSIYDHYGLSPYWSGSYLGGYRGPFGSTPFPVAGTEEQNREIADAEHDRYNPSLRSFKLVTGYHVESRDGDIGHVEDFLVEDADWSIHFLVIDTRNWWPGKRVLISPRSVLEIDWQTRMMTLDVDRQKVKDGPAYDPSTVLDKTFEQHLHRHYGLPSGNGAPSPNGPR